MESTDVIKKLEQRVKNLEDKFEHKPDKKTRKKSDYNIFVQDYIAKNKNPKKTHKELFSEAAKTWTKNKVI